MPGYVLVGLAGVLLLVLVIALALLVDDPFDDLFPVWMVMGSVAVLLIVAGLIWWDDTREQRLDDRREACLRDDAYWHEGKCFREPPYDPTKRQG
jgi:hypothetical protein